MIPHYGMPFRHRGSHSLQLTQLFDGQRNKIWKCWSMINRCLMNELKPREKKEEILQIVIDEKRNKCIKLHKNALLNSPRIHPKTESKTKINAGKKGKQARMKKEQIIINRRRRAFSIIIVHWTCCVRFFWVSHSTFDEIRWYIKEPNKLASECM